MSSPLPSAPSMDRRTTAGQAVVLFAHGSRDPLWHRPMEAVRDVLLQSQPGLACVCAYLEISSPSLPEAVDALVQQGNTAIRVLPLFLGTGRHAREDLPQLLADCRLRHPQLQLSAGTPVGEDPRVIQLLAEIALDGIYKEYKS